MSQIAADLLRDQAAYEGQRSSFDATNQRIAELIWPSAALFQTQMGQQGQRRDQYTFDATGALALPRFAAASESIICPRTQTWHTLAPAAEELAKLPSVRRYSEALTKAVFRARYAAAAGFTFASGEHFASLGAFGNGCTFLDDDVGRSLRYRSIFPGMVWVATDHTGRINRCHRKLTLSARQALAKFATPPERVVKAAKKNPEHTFDFLHCVLPRTDLDPGRRDFRGMAWASYYLLTGEGDWHDEGGYRRMPYLFSRFSTAPGETYGRGPASMVLPTLNTVNEQSKTMLRAGQRAVDPPIMTVDDDGLDGFNMKSSAINAGYLNAEGKPLAVPFHSGAQLPWGGEAIADSRAVINDAFFVTLFQILIQSPQMTATEALLKAQEKGELLGPSVGRQQAEYIEPMVERELDILSTVPGLLPEMPPELREAGGIMTIKHASPLDKLRRAGEGAAMLRHVEAITPVAAFKREVLDGINWKKWGQELAEIQGVPASVMVSEEEADATTSANAEAEQMQQMVQAAPLAGKAALDMARAQELAMAQPSAAGLL